MGKALIPDRYVDIFQDRAAKGVLAKHYTPEGIRLLSEIYDKANLRLFYVCADREISVSNSR